MAACLPGWRQTLASGVAEAWGTKTVECAAENGDNGKRLGARLRAWAPVWSIQEQAARSVLLLICTADKFLAIGVEMCILTPRCETSMKFHAPSHRPFPA